LAGKTGLPLDAPRHCRHHIAQSWIYRQNWTRTMPYQSVIGILRWAVELGRVDITTEVSMLSSHLCPVTDTLLVLCIFAYLEKKHCPNGI
jgi:hypothetical protein